MLDGDLFQSWTSESYSEDTNISLIKNIINEILEVLNSDATVERLDAIRQSFSEDDCLHPAVQHMRHIFPFLCQLQMEVLSQHGFNASMSWLVWFMLHISRLEKEDEEVFDMAQCLRSHLFPIGVITNGINDAMSSLSTSSREDSPICEDEAGVVSKSRLLSLIKKLPKLYKPCYMPTNYTLEQRRHARDALRQGTTLHSSVARFLCNSSDDVIHEKQEDFEVEELVKRLIQLLQPSDDYLIRRSSPGAGRTGVAPARRPPNIQPPSTRIQLPSSTAFRLPGVFRPAPFGGSLIAAYATGDRGVDGGVRCSGSSGFEEDVGGTGAVDYPEYDIPPMHYKAAVEKTQPKLVNELKSGCSGFVTRDDVFTEPTQMPRNPITCDVSATKKTTDLPSDVEDFQAILEGLDELNLSCYTNRRQHELRPQPIYDDTYQPEYIEQHMHAPVAHERKFVQRSGTHCSSATATTGYGTQPTQHQAATPTVSGAGHMPAPPQRSRAHHVAPAQHHQALYDLSSVDSIPRDSLSLLDRAGGARAKRLR